MNPSTVHPLDSQETARVIRERLYMVNFGPEGWLSEKEMKLILQVIVLKEKAISLDET